MANKKPSAEPQIAEPARAVYRTGAVARMLRMPAATLRIWERRYGVTSPATTPSGNRLNSAADVRRLALVRELTGLGLPIGSLAALDDEGLREVASTHADALTRAPGRKQRRASPRQVAVVGPRGEHRLQRPGVQLRLDRAVCVADPLPMPGAAPPRRRYDDATLADFAGLSSTIACECPRHLAEIVMQLSHFEAYSAQCQPIHEGLVPP